MLDYLRPLGNALDIPRRLIGFISEYMRTYLIDGTPDFSGDSYFDVTWKTTQAQARSSPSNCQLHVVDSYSMSVSLCLATLGFLRVYRQGLRSQRMQRGGRRAGEALARQRLTAAMVGLLRSFTVNTFEPERPARARRCAG